MGGLAVVLLLVGYLALSVWLIAKVRGARAKLIVLAIALLLPTADAIVGRLYLKHLCAREGGLRVSREVRGVEGFLDGGGRREYWLREHAFRFVEVNPKPGGKVDRLEWKGTEAVLVKDVPRLSAYRLAARRKVPAGWRMALDEDVVLEIDSGEVLGRYVDYHFRGGWVEVLVGMLSDAGPGAVAHCELPEPAFRRDVLLVTSVFPN